MRPPPATISGRFAALINSTARSSASAAGGWRKTVHTRGSRNSAGTANASVWTSSGSAIVTAPVSRRIRQHPHRLESCRDDLNGALYTVEEARDRPEAVVDRDRRVMTHLELLEHGVRQPAREGVGGQQQHGKAVDRRQRRARDHVRRPGSDRRRADICAEPVALASVAGGDMNHRLFVAPLMEGDEIAVLLERLTQSGGIAMPQDSETSGEERAAHAVTLNLLCGQEAHERLSHGQCDRLRHLTTCRASVLRRSRACRVRGCRPAVTQSPSPPP